MKDVAAVEMDILYYVDITRMLFSFAIKKSEEDETFVDIFSQIFLSMLFGLD